MPPSTQEGAADGSKRRGSLIVRLAPPLLASGALLLAHAALFGAWLADGAGIALVYARNFAEGHGLVAQPGDLPLEGFDSPVWTVLLAAGHPTGALSLPWPPKLAGLACAIVAFGVIIGARQPAGPAAAWRAALPAGLLALDTSFVAWTASGLEHGLHALLGLLSCVLAARAAEAERLRPALASGLAAAALALTRPEAALYATLPPFVWAASPRSAAVQGGRRRLTVYVLAVVPPLGIWQAFRLVHFGDPLPNAFLVSLRAAPGAEGMRVQELLSSLAGPLVLPVAAFLGLGLLGLLRRGRLTPVRLSVALHLAVGLALASILPDAGAQESPSATLSRVLLYWLLAEILEGLWVERRRATAQRRFAASVAVSAVLASGVYHRTRSLEFAAHPPMPLRQAADLGRACARIASRIGAARASLLTPDPGGALFEGGIRVVDLTGRCDRGIARTLGRDPTDLVELVLGTLRPTFIHLRGSWVTRSALAADPRFAADYAALHEIRGEPDVSPPRRGPAPPVLGLYVRRDALGDASLSALREALAAAAGPGGR
jgi:hypothetical protein